MIRNLQRQQQGRIIDPKLKFEYESLDMDQGNFGNGSNEHGGNGVEYPQMGVPQGNEPEPKGNPQP